MTSKSDDIARSAMLTTLSPCLIKRSQWCGVVSGNNAGDVSSETVDEGSSRPVDNGPGSPGEGAIDDARPSGQVQHPSNLMHLNLRTNLQQSVTHGRPEQLSL